MDKYHHRTAEDKYINGDVLGSLTQLHSLSFHVSPPSQAYALQESTQLVRCSRGQVACALLASLVWDIPKFNECRLAPM